MLVALDELDKIEDEIRRRDWSENGALLLDCPAKFRPLTSASRYKGLYGGRGAGKSHFFAEMLLERCLVAAPQRAVCVREIQKSLSQSVKLLLEDKILAIPRYRGKFRVMNTHVDTPGGGIIIFQGMQDHTAESVKSLEGYDVAWVEEAQALSQRSLDLLRPTIRKERSELWFSWNPRRATDPVEFLRSDKCPDEHVVRKVNYFDNPRFPVVLHREMEWDRARDPEKYAHVWLGEHERHSELRVFKNWRVEEFETPDNQVFYLGADWGFSVDPTVLVRCWLVSPRLLMVDWEVYRIGCEIEDTPTLFDSLGCEACSLGRLCDGKNTHRMARDWTITADSARPETISHVRRHGYPRIRSARKGPGSIEEGVKWLQNYDIVVHPRCKHTIDELTLYSYKADKLTGMVTPILEDKKNHVIDSLRYATESIRRGASPREVALPVLEVSSDWKTEGYATGGKPAGW